MSRTFRIWNRSERDMLGSGVHTGGTPWKQDRARLTAVKKNHFMRNQQRKSIRARNRCNFSRGFYEPVSRPGFQYIDFDGRLW